MAAQMRIQRQTGVIYGNALQGTKRRPEAAGHLSAFRLGSVLRNPVVQISGMIKNTLRAGQQEGHAGVRGEQRPDAGMAGQLVFPAVIDLKNMTV